MSRCDGSGGSLAPSRRAGSPSHRYREFSAPPTSMPPAGTGATSRPMRHSRPRRTRPALRLQARKTVSLQLVKLLARQLGRERNVHSIFGDASLSVAAEDVGKEFLKTWSDRLAGFAVQVDVESGDERIIPIADRLKRWSDGDLAVAYRQGQGLHAGVLLDHLHEAEADGEA